MRRKFRGCRDCNEKHQKELVRALCTARGIPPGTGAEDAAACAQGTEPQVTTEAEVSEETVPREAQPAVLFPAETLEAMAQAREDAQAVGEQTMAETLGGEATGQEPAIVAEAESTEAAAQPESDAPAKKLALKGKRKKGATPTENADK